MEILFYSKYGEGSIIIDKEDTRVEMDKNTDLYRRIKEELEIGMSVLSNFKNEGIPGKIKKYRSYKDYEDVLRLLHSLKKEFFIYYIFLIKCDNFNSRSIVDIENYDSKKFLEDDRSIREFDDKYEYYIIKDYEEKLEGLEYDSVQIEEVFVKILTIKDRKLITSIDFPKEKFNLIELSNWLGSNSIRLMSDDETYLINARRIKKGLKFRGTPIVLYEKGDKDLVVFTQHLAEVTEKHIYKEKKAEVGELKKMYAIKPKMDIIINGIEVDYIPEIEIDLSKDLLISNGNIIVANYVGDYYGCIGFFCEKGDDLPIAWIHEAMTIYIQVYWEDGRRNFIFEYQSNIDIDKIL